MFFSDQLCFVALLGIASHLGFFIHGEHHLQAPSIFRAYLAIIATLLLALSSSSTTYHEAGMATILIVASYSTALFLSMIIYRTVFHRLHSIPGPFMAKVTKFWNVAKAIDSSNYRLMDELHRQYGDFVRTGKKDYITKTALYTTKLLMNYSQAQMKWLYSKPKLSERWMLLAQNAPRPRGMIFSSLEFLLQQPVIKSCTIKDGKYGRRH